MIFIKKLLLTIIILAILISGALYYFKINQPNEEVINFSNTLYLIVEDNVISDKDAVIIHNEVLYFSFDIIKQYVDENIFYDEYEKIVTFTGDTKVKRYIVNKEEASINSKIFFIDNVIKEINNIIYIPKDLIDQDYNADINYYEGTGAVVVDYKNIYYLTGEIIDDKAAIRSDMDIKKPIFEGIIQKKELVNVYEEYDNWYKVRTIDGINGFIQKKHIKLNHVKDIYKTRITGLEHNNNNNNSKINMTWDYTYGKVKNGNNIIPIPGINTIAPTWFSVIDENGKILDKGNKDYVKNYKSLGYEIWPMFDNSFDPSLTHEFLKLSKTRENIINNILNIFMDYGFDGINIDFENVNLEDRDLLTQFVRELYPIFKENKLTVSMDVTPISNNENWSVSFDRVRLKDTTDFMVLMAYDQHWASSPIAGSVAEFTWVENNLRRVLKLIPNDMLILAIPLYSRVWTTENDKVSSQAITMEVANKFILSNNIQLEWDSIAGQYYGETYKDNKFMQIWLEDSKSLEYKASLIHKYDLAGISSWRKGFETPNIWTTLAGIVE